MHVCPFCGQNVGFLRSEHWECRRKHDTGANNLRRMIYDAIVAGNDLPFARQQAESLSRACFIPVPERLALLTDAWEQAIDYYIRARQLTQDNLHRLLHAADALGLDRAHLQRMGVTEKLRQYQQDIEHETLAQAQEQALTLTREQTLTALRQGELPSYPFVTRPLPFLLGADQQMIWLFEGVSYHEERPRRGRARRPTGLGSLDMSQMTNFGTGPLALTSHYLYFLSDKKNIRIALDTVITLKPYKDGLELVSEAVIPQRLLFIGLDGAFAFEIIQAVSSVRR